MTDTYHPFEINRGGRPSHEPTDKLRERVRIGLASGWAVKRIAAALNLSEATLRKHYAAELAGAEGSRDGLRLELMAISLDLARGGKVAAVQTLAAMIAEERGEAKGAVGVKEKRAAAAKAGPAGTAFDGLDPTVTVN